ncbi:MAG: methyl-accepting chemotaxis protein [Alphaproteobacteria bacterium]
MARWTGSMSIRWRLVLVTVTTSVLAQLFAGAILTLYDDQVYKAQKAREAAVQAGILSASLAASLVFHDAAATREYLNPLKANPEIGASGAYGGDGALVASYSRAGTSPPLLPPSAPAVGQRFAGDDLMVSVPVVQGTDTVGTLYLQVGMEPLASRLMRSVGIVLLAIAGSLAVAVPISMRLNRAIADPIREIAGAASRIIAGDLSVKPTLMSRDDEIGVLVRTFDEMVASLRQMTAEVNSGAKVLAETANAILTAMTQASAGSTETATAIGETSATMEQVKQTVERSAAKAQQVSEGAQRTAQAAQSGREAVEAVTEGMANIREQVSAVADTILRLSEHSQMIGEIIAAVNDLADESNLLAVNAAIEAAHAGEQGRGFAVVALEVRNLAEQSKEATAKVRTILGEIQKATGAAVLATEQGSKAVDAGVAQSARAGESIRVLAESIAGAVQAAMQIAASSQQQLAGVSHVALAMENIRQASEKNVAGIRQTEVAARDMNELGRKLETLVEKYRS